MEHMTDNPSTRAPLTVGQVAAEYGVTVRTLHHYDEIGLLRPSQRAANGYRLYDGADLERLQHVVVYRRLGFPLEDVAALLDADDATTVAHLRRQRAAVMGRLGELEGLVRAIDNAIDNAVEARMSDNGGYGISRDEQKELFGTSYDDPYAQEAQERWGDTPQWAQSQERAKKYTREDWDRIKAEGDAVMVAFAAAKRSGEPATSQAAMDAADEHHAQIERWFYDCPWALHRGLGDMFVADPRFAKTYEDVEPGLSAYVRDAIHANADRREA